MHPFWITAFLDLEAPVLDDAAAFWAAVSGSTLSSTRGEHEEFATLEPADGDAFLRVQRLGDGPSRIHLDLHVPDPEAAALAAVGLGARLVHRADDGYVVLTSPAGLVLCFVPGPAARRPTPVAWPGGRSLVDQVCLDVPAARFEAEAAFWQAVTGWQARRSSGSEFAPLQRPRGIPLRLMVQRVDDDRDPATAHLDLAVDDRELEAARHQALGATLVRRSEHWTVLSDPAGRPYCLTDRDPDTGLTRPVEA